MNDHQEKLNQVLKLIDELVSYDKNLQKCPYTLNYILNTIYDYIINDKVIE